MRRKWPRLLNRKKHRVPQLRNTKRGPRTRHGYANAKSGVRVMTVPKRTQIRHRYSTSGARVGEQQLDRAMKLLRARVERQSAEKPGAVIGNLNELAWQYGLRPSAMYHVLGKLVKAGKVSLSKSGSTVRVCCYQAVLGPDRKFSGLLDAVQPLNVGGLSARAALLDKALGECLLAITRKRRLLQEAIQVTKVITGPRRPLAVIQLLQALEEGRAKAYEAERNIWKALNPIRTYYKAM